MPTYDYKCSQGHLTERRAGYGDDTPIVCSACRQLAMKQSVYLIVPFTESGVQVGRLCSTPRNEKRINLAKFQEAAADMDYHHKQLEESVGHQLPAKDYYHEGLRQAQLVLEGKRPMPKEF